MVMHGSDGRSDEQRLNNKAGVGMEIGFPRNHRLAKQRGGQFSAGGGATPQRTARLNRQGLLNI